MKEEKTLKTNTNTTIKERERKKEKKLAENDDIGEVVI